MASPAETAPDWRWALPRIAALFVTTRLFLLGVAVAVEATQAAPPAWLRWTDTPLLTSLTIYDSRYYLGIAVSGYHAAPVFGPYVDYVFFPLFPILARIGSILTLGDVDIAGVLVANAAFGASLVAIYGLGIRHMGRDPAMWSLVFIAVAPGAFAFGLAYSDGLFLLLAATAFLAAETRRPVLTGLLVALATLTRPPGVLLAIPLLVLVLRDPDMRARRAWAWLALGPLALALFSAHLASVTGDPLAWLHGQSLWTRPYVIALGESGGSPTSGALSASASAELLGLSYFAFAVWLGSILFHLFLFVYFRPDRMPATYWLVAAIPFAGLVAGSRITSSTRFLAVAWPFDWVLARRRAAWVRLVLPTLFLVLQGALAWLAFTWKIHP